MATITTRSPVDPNDDSIETSLNRFEKKLRWVSPLLLGFFQTFWPHTYRSAVGISTIVGYVLFFIPSIIGASVTADYVLGEPVFTTIGMLIEAVSETAMVLTFAEPIITVGILTVLYTVFVFDFDPEEPNGTRESEPYNWQQLRQQYIPSALVFAGGAIATVVSTYTIAPFVAVLGAWWITRRLTFTIVGDEALYLVEPPYTEFLLASRVPFALGLLLLVFGISTIGAFALMAVPFLVTIPYLRWRRWAGDDNSHNLPDKNMLRDSGIPTDMASDYTTAGAYRAYGNEQLFRETVRKFNSFLDTEIDTERRLSLPEDRLFEEDIDRIQHNAHDIYSDFNTVAYRPERFSDLVDTIDKYGDQLLEVMDKDEQRVD